MCLSGRQESVGACVVVDVGTIVRCRRTACADGQSCPSSQTCRHCRLLQSQRVEMALCQIQARGTLCTFSHTLLRRQAGLQRWNRFGHLALPGGADAKSPREIPEQSRAEPGCDTRTHPTTSSKACKVDVCCYLANYGGGELSRVRAPTWPKEPRPSSISEGATPGPPPDVPAGRALASEQPTWI